jgi:hypothetical protein
MRARAALVGSLAIAWLLSGTAPFAQEIPLRSLEGQVLGWIKVYDFKDATAPLTAAGRVYSARQLSIGRMFANWMQASYLPTGALGDVKLTRNDDLGLYNQDSAALPQKYGAEAPLYMQLKYDANKKIVPLTSDALFWTIEANGPFGSPTDAVNTPERFYFTMPTFEQLGYGPELEKAADVSKHPVLGQFPSFFGRNSRSGNRKYLIVTKNHQLPVVKVTRGQYLDALGEALVRRRASELKRLTEANRGRPEEVDKWMKIEDANTARRVAVLDANRQKYRNRLQETAELQSDQPTVIIENETDAFESGGGAPKRLTVYAIDPKMMELSRTDAPQWITISWTAQLNDPISLSLHQALQSNFNLQYLYDYFFDPEKVKGQPYKPLRSPAAFETVAAGKISEAATKSAADPSVHFFDDFSSGSVGKKPLNWKSTLDNTGASSVVTELNGLNGHWASMAGMHITPTGLKTPLPPDFEMSYDVVAAKDYRWGARGLTMRLSKAPAAGAGESFLNLRIRPGFSGREGELVIEGQFPGAPAYMGGSKFVAAPGFSNDLAINRVTVTIKKRGDLLQVFVGTTKVAEYEKGVPAALQFDSLYFELSSAPEEKMFLGNVRIVKN